MLRTPTALLALACLTLVSCSTSGNLSGYTKADLATLRLRDLNPLAKTAPVVPVHQNTLAEISEERLAQLRESRGFLWFRKPVNWTPPTLPEGAYANDGSLLPPKTGTLAVLNADGYLPDNHAGNASPSLTADSRQDFSIE